MKLMSFDVGGHRSWGLAVEHGVVDLGNRDELGAPTLRSALGRTDLVDFVKGDEGASADWPWEDVSFLPVVDLPAKVLCVGLNYEAHRIETGRPRTEHPVIFTRFPDTLVGSGEPLVRPAESEQFDYEGELAVVIGRPCRRVDRNRAMEFVAGFTCFNDGSVRDFQAHTHQFTPGKNFPATAALGPWMVTPDELRELASVQLTTRLNNEVVQHTELSDLTYSIAEIISYCSTWTELTPGDVIATGTPGGVGSRRTPPLWMRPDDVCEVDIAGIGVLRNPVVGEDLPG